MTHEEKRLIMRTAQELRHLEARVAAQAALIDRLLRRKAGRPTKEEAAELEVLQERMNGSHY